ncbi:MAG TPA: 3-dehydroquinate synthase [Longimicrobiales bacterium]|nr:3-dehydroquinate synthase [Longimicrobiales bacterium]
MSEVRVRTGEGHYPVLVGVGVFNDLPSLLGDHAPAQRYAFISDDNVAALHGHPLMERAREAGLDASLFTFPAGEASKTRRSWSILTDELLEAGFGRDSCVVAVGGGVTTDLAGFVAATFLRGVPVVQVPTSYLAMIDASVGGKTGVDVTAGKNLVGAFHPPRLVVIDADAVRTLPREQRAQGLVEAFKHGAILDADYFGRVHTELPALLDAEPRAVEAAVLRSVELKAAVVSEDEREGGYRQVLNFGHTLGHALEAASDYGLGHGSAVALGMVLEAEVGERLGITEPGTRVRLAAVLDGLVHLGPVSLDLDATLRYLRADKKARAGRPRIVLLRSLGAVDSESGWSHEVDEALLAEVLEEGMARGVGQGAAGA